MSLFSGTCCRLFDVDQTSSKLVSKPHRVKLRLRPREEGLVAKASHNLTTQSLFLYLSQGVKSIGLSKVSKQNRLGEF